MNESNSLERRYSFNMAQGNPVAESTHINGSSFSWGSTSPKLRSSSNLNNTTTPLYYNDESTVNSKSRNLNKIDVRVAADVQSKGLASRIVRYHDSGNRLSRSMSAHNLYSKPGQFPAVTLKRTDLPYRATKKELSMIRIPPPDKSSFYGNTISSLMRSSSVIGLQSKQKEDISRENRPIIHPPPTENDLAPTRSVLDVLKEISRKRINSDDLESDESSKKYCSRTGNDFIDVANSKGHIVQQNFTASSSLTCQRYKRQRDCVMPHQDVHLLQPRTSPEQAKKRICNYNNDITSSLSSSIKCKRLSSAPQNLNCTTPPNLGAYEIQILTEQRHDELQKNNYKDVDIKCKILDSTNSIAHITETACGQGGNNANDTGPIRAVAEPYFNSDGKVTNSLISLVQKPRLTLFNKNCDDDETSLASEPNEFEEKVSDDLNELNECAGISFVIPKKITSKRALRNPVMERTQKSKLALMLSGLRGELYQHSDIDELDSTHEKEKLDINKHSNKKGVLSAIDSKNKVPTSTTITSAIIVASSKPSLQPPNSSNASVNKLSPLGASTSNGGTSMNTIPSLQSPISSNISENKLSSPLVGLKLPKSKPSSQNNSSMLGIDPTKNTALQSTMLDNAIHSSIVNSSCSNINNDSKTTTAKITSVPTTSNNIIKIGTAKPLSGPLDFGDNNQQHPVSLQLSSKIDLPYFPTAAVQTTLPSSTILPSHTPSSTTVSKTLTFVSNVNSSLSENNISKPAGTTWSFNSNGKLDNISNFPSTSTLISDTSTVPTVFGNLPSATPITKFSLTNVEVPKTRVPASNTVVTSENSVSSSSTPLFNFNSNTLSTSSEAKPSSGGISSLSFNVDKNQCANPVTVFGTNSFTNKIQTVSSGFTLTSNAKSPDTSSGEQIKQNTDKITFKSNAPTPFDSECLNSKVTGSSISIFGKVTEASKNSVANPLATAPIFGTSSVKSGTEIFGSLANSKSAVLVTPTFFEANKVNNNTSTPFSFTSNPTTFAATSLINNASNSTGGFSFNSTVSGSNEEKSSGKTSTLSNASASISKTNFMSESSSNKPHHSSNLFGVTVNKQPANSTSGGFSFGPSTPAKTSTFAFGTAKNSSAIDVINASNHSTGFVFGAAANTKQNEIPNNKSFSFGSPQQMQQKPSEPIGNGNSFNIFGLNGATKTTQPPAFNFNSGNSQSNASTTSNIFAPPSSNGTTGPGDRPIRRATRRLQK